MCNLKGVLINLSLCPHILLIAVLFLSFVSCADYQIPSNEASVRQSDQLRSTLSSPDTSMHLEFSYMIYSIFQDSKGNYWFGSDKEGVCRFDGTLFTYYTVSDGLSNNQVRSIQEDRQGNIWFGTGAGISCFCDGEMKSFTGPNQYSVGNIGDEAWPSTIGGSWISNGDAIGGICHFDFGVMTFLPFPTLDSEHKSFSITGPVTDIAYGKDNRLWIASYDGVIGYDGRVFSYINERGYDYHVRALFEDSKGNLWIGNNGIGVLKYDGNTSYNFTTANGLDKIQSVLRHPLTSKGTLNHIFAIAEDHQGNIWFGDRDTGAWKYNGQSLKNYTSNDGLSSSIVRAIYCDAKGDILLGMGDGNVYRYNGKGFDKIY